jgi:hypothetical protein
MFIHLTAKEERNPAEKGRIAGIRKALQGLMDLLNSKGLLAGLQQDRIGEEITSRTVELNVRAQNTE